MLSLKCSLSLLFLFFFLRVSRGRKECSSVCFNEDIRYMSFFPNTKMQSLSRDERRENRFISQKSLSFPSFFCSLSRLSFRSLSFSSQKAFVVVTVIKDLITKRERFAVKLFQIRNSYRTRDPYFRGTNHVASNASFANVWSTGSVLPIRVVSSSSFSSRVKSTLHGVYRY